MKGKELELLFREVYQLGIESTFSPAKAKSRDKRLESIIEQVAKKEGQNG